MTKYFHTSTRLCFFLFCIIVFQSAPVMAQGDAESFAKQLFKTGQYEEAVPIFRELVRLYPADKDLNYHLGASLIEAKQFTAEAQSALTIVGNKNPRSYFYIGQYYHSQSEWINGLKNYDKFRNEAQKKEVKASGVDDLIDQCRKQINPFETVEPAKPVAAVPQEPQPAQPEGRAVQPGIETVQPDTATNRVADTFTIPKELKTSIINFQVNGTIKYIKVYQFKVESSMENFAKGWLIEQELQAKQDTLNTLREKYGNLIGGEKEKMAVQILWLEQETFELDQKAGDAYMAAGLKEADYWDKADALEIHEFKQEIARLQDSIRAINEEAQRVTAAAEVPVLVVDTMPADSLSAPRPVQDQIVYKIQIGAYKKSPPDWVQRLYSKLAVIRRIDKHVDDQGVTVYTVGELTSFSDAVQMQQQIRMEGVKDAFVAAYKNNKRISLEEAKKLTRE